MTAETFVAKMTAVLSSVSGVNWNSVTQSKLRALGRAFERGEIAPQDVITQLRILFPLSSIKGAVEAALLKSLR